MKACYKKTTEKLKITFLVEDIETRLEAVSKRPSVY